MGEWKICKIPTRPEMMVAIPTTAAPAFMGVRSCNHHQTNAISSLSSLAAIRFPAYLPSANAPTRGHSLRSPPGGNFSLRKIVPRHGTAVSALSSPIPFELSSLTIGTLVAIVLSFGAVRAFVYFRLQYIIAAMLRRYVPRGGSRVLDLSIHEGRNLYYYPNDVTEVVSIVDKKNFEVVKNQAIRAGVPINIKTKALNVLGLPSNTMDAVVSVYCLCDLTDATAKAALHEAIRLLKPGKPFIFVENVVADSQFVRMSQTLIQNALKLLGVKYKCGPNIRNLLEEAEGLENLEYEIILGYQDPHIVGVAKKQSKVAENVAKRNRKTGSLSP